MEKRRLLKRLTGFTLIEIIVASAVFSLFVTGVFSFYRMGSRMFVSGSWRLQKQKEVELFLTILKERMEQASNATIIDPSNVVYTDQSGLSQKGVFTAKCNFLTLKNDSEIKNIDSFKRLMLFSVCKPDKTLLQPGNNDYRGLILYHALVAVPDHAPVGTDPEKNLYTLYFHASVDRASHNGIDYFNTTKSFEPITNVATFTNNFTNTPSFFSYGTAPKTYKLSEVAISNITWSIASGTDSSNSEKVLGIKIKMVNEKNPETTVQHSMQAKIDLSIPLISYDLGGF